MQPREPAFSVFYFFTDSSRRRAALRAEPGSAERYTLYALDQLVERGVKAGHNLEGSSPSCLARRAERLLNRRLHAAGGFGGEFATILSSRRRANAADVVFATVDSVATPVALARRVSFVRRPLVYGSVGLPERLARLRGPRTTGVFSDALSRAAAIVAYSTREVELLQDWFEAAGRRARVVFVPFGVDTDYFRPVRDGQPQVDVVSVGADSHRDFRLLLGLAERRHGLRIRIVASPHSWPALTAVPANVEVERDVPFSVYRERLASAKVVALPVEQNVYSGATTVLLHAMAMGKPVVISRTEAIASGYGLVDGDNCRLVEPGDATAFEAAVSGLLADDAERERLGAGARETVERSFTWRRYADSIWSLLAEAAETEGRR